MCLQITPSCYCLGKRNHHAIYRNGPKQWLHIREWFRETCRSSAPTYQPGLSHWSANDSNTIPASHYHRCYSNTNVAVLQTGWRRYNPAIRRWVYNRERQNTSTQISRGYADMMTLVNIFYFYITTSSFPVDRSRWWRLFAVTVLQLVVSSWRLYNTQIKSICLYLVLCCSACLLDISFVIDYSGSIRDTNVPPDDNWMHVINFMVRVVSSLTIGVSGTHVGAVSFGMMFSHRKHTIYTFEFENSVL